jgi:N-acetylneuraminic acid mutarotase
MSNELTRGCFLGVALRALAVAALPGLALPGCSPSGEEPAPGRWQTLAPSGRARQEVSYAEAGGKLYLAGGQAPGIGRTALHERYAPKTDSWEEVAPLPSELDHVQGAELGGKIYYVGGLPEGPDPHSNAVFVYDPKTDSFEEGTPMPAGRGRGAGGVAAYGGKVYYAGGLHGGEAVPWFDAYDPGSGSWERLPEMPRPRDHFQAAVVNGTFYAIAGRDTSIDATIAKVDAYDLTEGSAGSWRTLNTELPTPRGGFAAAVLNEEILVIGGEGGGRAYDAVEAYDTVKGTWRTLAPMPTARHGIQAAVYEGGVYVAAGGTAQGGGDPTDVHEVLFVERLNGRAG